jgi:Glycosyl hydrolase family 79 C-terminal beta domain
MGSYMTGSADRDELPTARLSPRPRLTMRGLIVAFLIIAAVVVVAVLATRSGSPAASAPASRPAAPLTTPAQAPESGQADVTIGAHESVTAIPHSFLGFSTEYWTLPVDEHHISLYKRILSMIHVQGDGRFVLRIGGDSSDHAVWDPAARRLPPWAYAVTPALVRRTARIVRQLGLRVIIDLNTFTSTPRLGAQWARAAEAGFPKGSIIGFEIGNEPDLYSHAEWVSELKGSGFDLAKLPLTITPASYVRDYRAFARALISVVPRVPLLAPALANPVRDLNWIVTLLRSPHPGLRVVSVHRYPYSACSSPGKPNWPTIPRLLSEQATAGMAHTVRQAVALGRRAGLPVRLTEINSVTCGGVRGVSNSFATALWAPDALFELVRSGVIGADLHLRVYSVNAPFYYDTHGIRPRPLLYGLILFKRMLGPDSRLVPVQLRTPRSLHLKVWAVREGADTLNVLVINKGARSTTVNLHLPPAGPGSVQRLLAPSAYSKSGVTLDGQSLSDQVIWHGRAQTQTVTPSRGRYALEVRDQSAALLTVHVAPGTLTGP